MAEATEKAGAILKEYYEKLSAHAKNAGAKLDKASADIVAKFTDYIKGRKDATAGEAYDFDLWAKTEGGKDPEAIQRAKAYLDQAGTGIKEAADAIFKEGKVVLGQAENFLERIWNFIKNNKFTAGAAAVGIVAGNSLGLGMIGSILLAGGLAVAGGVLGDKNTGGWVARQLDIKPDGHHGEGEGQGFSGPGVAPIAVPDKIKPTALVEVFKDGEKEVVTPVVVVNDVDEKNKDYKRRLTGKIADDGTVTLSNMVVKDTKDPKKISPYPMAEAVTFKIEGYKPGTPAADIMKKIQAEVDKPETQKKIREAIDKTEKGSDGKGNKLSEGEYFTKAVPNVNPDDFQKFNVKDGKGEPGKQNTPVDPKRLLPPELSC